jgi:Ca2+-dependent lipid-binding protein
MLLECMDYQHLTKDRSLGFTELDVSELASPSPAPEDARYPFKSNGIKTFTSPLRQDGGSMPKGTLHYTAEFIPAVVLKNLKFESQDMEVNKLSKREEQGEDGGVVTDESEDEDGVPIEVTIKSERKRTPSVHHKQEAGSKESVASKKADSKESGSVAEPDNDMSPKQEEAKGVEMSTEELLAQRESLCCHASVCSILTFIVESGIAIFHIISGHLQRKARLEVLLDDGYWPCFSTVKARSTHAQWGYVGEGFIKEIDFSRVWLRLCESDDADKGEVLAEWKGEAKAFLENTTVCWNLSLMLFSLNFVYREDLGPMSCSIGTTKLLQRLPSKADMYLCLSD